MENPKKQVVIGIDLHPDSFTAVALQGTALNPEQLWLDNAVANSGYRSWLKRRTAPNCILVFEASSNTFEYARIAQETSVRTVVADSRKLGKFRKAYCENDRIAARRIAKFHLGGMTTDSEIWQPDPITRTRRQVISTYEQAVKNSTRGKNQLRGYLNEHAVRLPKGFRLTAASSLGKILKLHPWNPLQQQLIAAKMQNLLHAEHIRRELRMTIINEVKNDPVMRDLIKLCGISAVTAFAIAASIGDITRFKTPKKLASYIGLIPCCHQSGGKEKRWGMTSYGLRHLKSMLIQAAQSIYRSKNRSGASLRQWGVKMTFRKGKPAAVAAMARKLAVAIWYQMKGLMPAIIEKPQVIRTKLRHLTYDLTEKAFKVMGYQSREDFFQEFCLLMDLRS